jgi:hypothetical protein
MHTPNFLEHDAATLRPLAIDLTIPGLKKKTEAWSFLQKNRRRFAAGSSKL